MRKILTIVRYECKMQFGRPAAWGILLAATAIAQLDNFPSARNLARLEFLNQPAYLIHRTMSLDALILAFGLLFLLSGRFALDGETGVRTLMMASPLRRGTYVFGKLLGGMLYTFSMLCLFLAANAAIYGLAAPFEIGAADCLVPLLKALTASALPVSIFIGFCSTALPALVNIRLFYLLSAVLFALNAAHVGTAAAAPFYLITSGDLSRLIWTHPKWAQTDMGSAVANLLFLVGSGLTSWTLLLLKRGFWRAK